jgi:hypothetical protein
VIYILPKTDCRHCAGVGTLESSAGYHGAKRVSTCPRCDGSGIDPAAEIQRLIHLLSESGHPAPALPEWYQPAVDAAGQAYFDRFMADRNVLHTEIVKVCLAAFLHAMPEGTKLWWDNSAGMAESAYAHALAAKLESASFSPGRANLEARNRNAE